MAGSSLPKPTSDALSGSEGISEQKSVAGATLGIATNDRARPPAAGLMGILANWTGMER
jgi:hypothetical protein